MSEATQIIAIDGPAGAGKSSTARAVAERLGFAFLDTGAMYRAATWWAMHNKIDLSNPDALVENTRQIQLDIRDVNGAQRVTVNGHDVTEAIRSPEVTRLIYRLDQNAEVRRQLVALQRKFGEQAPTVAEGRDIGTVVFPKARCKIYMDASAEVRAERRCKQLADQNIFEDYEEILQAIIERDTQAMQREESPLRQAANAVRLDTSELNFDEVVEAIITLARKDLCL